MNILKEDIKNILNVKQGEIIINDDESQSYLKIMFGPFNKMYGKWTFNNYQLDDCVIAISGQLCFPNLDLESVTFSRMIISESEFDSLTKQILNYIG